MADRAIIEAQYESQKIISRGAEAIIVKLNTKTVRKIRLSKPYRVRALDSKITKLRTRNEAKIISLLQRKKVSSPNLVSVDEDAHMLDMEFVVGRKVRDVLCNENVIRLSALIGTALAQMHNADVIHNDLTTSNILVSKGTIVLIDFGLSFVSIRTEDRAVDLHLLKQALDSYHYDASEKAFEVILAAYQKTCKDAQVIARLAIVEKRGKNKQAH